jgi:hypothetical protein
MSGGTKRLLGQNVRRYKMSGGTKRPATKRPFANILKSIFKD